ncbi:MAG: UbiA family prenyltransferase [Candidatus Andersenbacteria bacterium]|nr:UbiA family prenyltransferase [Candidatus Andersenbacteria bacterium]MBI3250941.1 UbiA family prenyltransferase [Candidatus Andersenbacteria bacterium]
MLQKPPLCVDLDGTLTLSDTMAEALFTLLKDKPFMALHVFRWMKSGKGAGKHEIASRAELVVDLLPYNEALIEYLKHERQNGRKLYLVTGSNEKFARMVAEHIGLFDDVIASSKARGMTGSDKAAALIDRFGEGKFAYAGNSMADLIVWKHASERILVNTSRGVAEAAKKLGPISQTIGEHRLSLKVFLRSIRWHQWIKNLLIFVPLLTAHQIFNIPALGMAGFAFISFSAIASAVYLLNDLVDLPADRQNPHKKHRPLASGKMTIKTALISGLTLGILSLLITLLLPLPFLWLILIYIVLNLAYSLRLKKVIALDVILITSLYVLRIFAGSAATGIPVSPWLLLFAALIFFSLALIKRVSEISNLEESGRKKATGRGYTVTHRKPLTILGLICSYLSLGVLALYITSPAVTPLYTTPILLWLLIPIFFLGLQRMWNVTNAGSMHEDPTVYAGKDWFSYAAAVITIMILFFAA